LEEYDVVNHLKAESNHLKAERTPTLKASERTPLMKDLNRKTKFVPQNLPNQYLNTTKADQFKTFKNIDQAIVERSLVYLKADPVQQHLDRIDQELQQVDEDDALSRLNVYSRTWENIILEFKTYGPLLAKIKKIYDDTIASYKDDQGQLGFLRNKVSNLLAKNENRMLLKVERKKVSRLHEEIQLLLQEKEKLKQDTFRKLSIYAAYIPESFKDDLDDGQNEVVKDSITKIRELISKGMDPLTCLETQVQELKDQVAQKSDMLEELQESISKDYVSKVSKELVDESLVQVKEKLSKVLEVNKDQELNLKKLNLELENLKYVQRDKEVQYDILLKEYTDLTEATAISFDKFLQNKSDE